MLTKETLESEIAAQKSAISQAQAQARLQEMNVHRATGALMMAEHLLGKLLASEPATVPESAGDASAQAVPFREEAEAVVE